MKILLVLPAAEGLASLDKAWNVGERLRERIAAIRSAGIGVIAGMIVGRNPTKHRETFLAYPPLAPHLPRAGGRPCRGSPAFPWS